MKKLYVVIFLFIFSFSPMTATLKPIFLEDLHHVLALTESYNKAKPTKNWKNYAARLPSGGSFHFKFPSIPVSSTSFDKVWITGKDDAENFYLLHIEEPNPEVSVTASQLAIAFALGFQENGFSVFFSQELLTAQNYAAADLHITNAENNFYMKWRFIDIEDGTIVFLCTLSANNEDSHEFFVNSIHIEND